MSLLTTYRAKCRLVQAAGTLAIVAMPFLNVLRIDIPTARMHLLGSVLWIDEFYIPFLVLMLALWSLVFFSMLYGRVWCGWMCPQTVLSQVVRWFEAGTRKMLSLRTRSPRLTLRVICWSLVAIQLAAVSLLVGFNVVAYFVDPYRMLGELATGQLSPLIRHFIIGIALLVFVDIMFWRERFCTKACPYGMMQLLVTDGKTQIVRYDQARDADCLDCKACVRCCPVNIDIRTSPYQTECIYCGDCIDACDRILGGLHKPGLLAFSWGEKQRRDRWYEHLGLIDTKRWIILGLMVAYTIGLVTLVKLRQPLAITASGDRSTLFHVEPDGRIYNDYSVRVQNRSMRDGTFTLSCVAHGSSDDWRIHGADAQLALKSRESRTLRLSLSSTGSSLHSGPNPVQLSLTRTDGPSENVRCDAVFFMPQSTDSRPSAG